MTPLSQRPFAPVLPLLWVAIALHVVALLLAFGAAEAWRFMPIAVVYLALLACLARGWRWAGYVTFFASAVSGIIVLSTLWSVNALPGWWKLATLLAHWLTAGAVFTVLWHAAPSDPDQLGD